MQEFLKILIEADKNVFLFLNGLHTPILDFFMYWMSDRFIWIPLYGYVLYLLIKTFGKSALLVILLALIATGLSDYISVHLFKNQFQRLRPCHNEEISHLIHLVKNCGGQYGFVSSHAANTFALATFIARVSYYNIRWISIFFPLWALVVSYSRIYLGVHYPADVLGGMLLGILSGYVFFKIYSFIIYKHRK